MNRLLKDGLYTTILGTIILVFLGAVVWYGKGSFDEVAGWFALAAILLRAKDSLLGFPKKS